MTRVGRDTAVAASIKMATNMSSLSSFPFLLLLLLLLLPLSSFSSPHPPRRSFSVQDIDICANTSFSHSYYIASIPYCSLFNTSLVFNSSRYLIPSITSPPPIISLSNVHLTILNCTSSDPSYPLNYLFLTMYDTQSVTLFNTSLHAPHIWIYTQSNVTLDHLSHVSADGFAPSGLPLNPLPSNLTSGINGGGGGSGGVGGHGCTRDYPSARGGSACGDPVSPPRLKPQFGGPGSVGGNGSIVGEEGFGIGGGYIWIEIAEGNLIVDGMITANGEDAWHSSLPAGGGGGGFIVIEVSEHAKVQGSSGTSALISANGGSGVNEGGGGAGGRIYILAGTAQVYEIQAFGGGVSTAAQQCPVQGGGQGTIYLRTSSNTSQTFTELRCIGPQTDLTLIASTDFSNSSTVDKLVLTYCVLLTTPVVELTTSLDVYNSIMQPTTSDDLTIQCPTITTGSGSTIGASSLTILTNKLTVGSGDSIRFNGRCVINSTNSIDVQGKIIAPGWPAVSLPSASTIGLLTLTAPTITLDNSVAVSVVEIEAFTLTTAGSIVGSYQRRDANCSTAIPYISLNSTCSSLPFSFHSSTWSPWASVVIQSRTVTFGGNPALEGAIIAVCSEEMTVSGGATITTSGNGCPESQGEGAGALAGSGEGGGAGHGGEGGQGTPASSLLTPLSALPGGAGVIYDNGSIPCMMGSGGSAGYTGTGGSGGGLLYLEATQMTIGPGARLVSDGGGGTGEASGGGSGGSIILHLGSIQADPTTPSFISAAGGAATGGTGTSGGGGGGGRLFIHWFSSPPSNQHDRILFLATPGNGTSTKSVGQHGSLVTLPECGPGYAGVLCVSCTAGSYKNKSGPAECKECEGGRYSNMTGATECGVCQAGSFSLRNSTQCEACPVDSISGVGSGGCQRCPAGAASNERHTECRQCEEGTYKSSTDTACLPCGDGFFSNPTFDGCLPCPAPPSHAHYVSLIGSKCQYDCDVGYLLPDCLTPFWSMVESMGGVLVFVAFLVVSLTVTFIPFLCCFIRSKRRQAEKEILEQDEAETDSEAGDSLPPSPPSQSQLGRQFSAAPNYDHSTLNTSLMEQTRQLTFKDLPSTSLQSHHYPHHLHRIYLTGDNSRSTPFALSRSVPVEVASLVFDAEYGEFAEQVTGIGKWKRLDGWVYELLSLLCLPLAVSYLRSKRRRHVMHLWQFIVNYDHSMLRNAKSRALASSLLFGCSTCHTLAWIDVLANSREEKGDSLTGLPRLPLVLVASGDGSYHTPFHFDVSDAYVKSVTEFVGMNWYKFVRSVNEKVRTVRRSELRKKDKLEEVLRLLRVENHMGIGIGKNLPLGGVRVELGWVGEESGIGGGPLPALIITAKEESTAQLMTITTTMMGKTGDHRPSRSPQPLPPHPHLLSSRQPIFRRDDRSPQSSDSGRDAPRLSASYTSSSYLTSDEDDESGPSIMERALGQTGQRKVQQYLSAKQRLEAEQAQWRAQKKASSSYASLPKADEGQGTAAYRAFGKGEGMSSASKKMKGERRNSLQERKEEGALDTSVMMQDVSPAHHQLLPYSASFYHFDDSRPPSAFPSPSRRSINSDDSRVTSSLSPLSPDLPSTRVPLTYRMQGLVLFNVPLYLSRTTIACLFLFLLFVRSCVSLIIFSSSYQLVRWLFFFAVLLYPAAPLFVPLLGLITLVSSSTHACRFFSCAVLLSLMNDIVVLVGSFYSFNTAMGYVDALLLPPVALLLTVMLLLTSHAYVAHLEVLKDLVMGRRDLRERERDEGMIVNQSPMSSRRGSRRGSVQGDSSHAERRTKERTKAGRSMGRGRVSEVESKSEDVSQPSTPATATSEEPITPLQASRDHTSGSASPVSGSPSHAVKSSPVMVPGPPPSSQSSVFVPRLSPVLPTPPSMGATHSLLSSSLVTSSSAESTSPPPTPLPPVTAAAPALTAAPAPAPLPPVARPAKSTTTSAPTSTHSSPKSTTASAPTTASAHSSPKGTPSSTARRGRGGARGGGGGGAVSPDGGERGGRGKAKRGVKRGA